MHRTDAKLIVFKLASIRGWFVVFDCGHAGLLPSVQRVYLGELIGIAV
jgi:hypothetical protein